MKSLINILVASGHDEDCKRILAILSNQDDFHIADVEKNEAGTIIKSARLKPDVLILDLQPHGMRGEELAPIIRRRSPSTAIVILCDKADDNYAGLALKAGISGVLIKEEDTDILMPVVRIVVCGGYYVSASITIRVFNSVALTKHFYIQEAEQKQPVFSPAERGIITDIAQGLSDLQIARHLHFSIGTIRNYLYAIKRKTKLKNRVQIVIFALVYGLISFEQLDFIKEKSFLIKKSETETTATLPLRVF